MNFRPLSKKEEELASQVVDAAFRVHKNLGSGLLEKVYEACFCHELTKRNINFNVAIFKNGIKRIIF